MFPHAAKTAFLLIDLASTAPARNSEIGLAMVVEEAAQFVRPEAWEQHLLLWASLRKCHSPPQSSVAVHNQKI